MPNRPASGYPFWDRFPPPSRLHLVVGIPPEPPASRYIPIGYVYETQCQMLARLLIDTLEKPFNWGGIQEQVLDRASWFFDVPTRDGAPWTINEVWKRGRRHMRPMYWLAITDLLAAVQQWQVEYGQWKGARSGRHRASPARTG